ncbi:MAG TPA: hypothetical protein VG897_01930 [Terriglobales bacterium]|nr:hypothetical protein [Terriglobales bacterium]
MRLGIEVIPNWLINSLYVAIANIALTIIAFLLFIFPRFTNIGGKVCLLILLVVAVDAVLVIRDLFRSGTRVRAVIAVLFWFPVAFLFLMVMQWEGPLYTAVSGNPPVFDIRGLSGVCSVDVYGPEQENAEWFGDAIGLRWSIDHTLRFPFEATFKYGEVPLGFRQLTPAGNATAQTLSPDVTYKVVLGRCMGGPQYLSLHGNSISEYKPNPNICWGELKIPERESSAYVRVDCKTHQPLPMSQRAEARLKQYREKHIPAY